MIGVMRSSEAEAVGVAEESDRDRKIGVMETSGVEGVDLGSSREGAKAKRLRR